MRLGWVEDLTLVCSGKAGFDIYIGKEYGLKHWAFYALCSCGKDRAYYADCLSCGRKNKLSSKRLNRNQTESLWRSLASTGGGDSTLEFLRFWLGLDEDEDALKTLTYSVNGEDVEIP